MVGNTENMFTELLIIHIYCLSFTAEGQADGAGDVENETHNL